jgi:hypothetical protein
VLPICFWLPIEIQFSGGRARRNVAWEPPTHHCLVGMRRGAVGPMSSQVNCCTWAVIASQPFASQQRIRAEIGMVGCSILRLYRSPPPMPEHYMILLPSSIHVESSRCLCPSRMSLPRSLHPASDFGPRRWLTRQALDFRVGDRSERRLRPPPVVDHFPIGMWRSKSKLAGVLACLQKGPACRALAVIEHPLKSTFSYISSCRS